MFLRTYMQDHVCDMAKVYFLPLVNRQCATYGSAVYKVDGNKLLINSCYMVMLDGLQLLSYVEIITFSDGVGLAADTRRMHYAFWLDSNDTQAVHTTKQRKVGTVSAAPVQL